MPKRHLGEPPGVDGFIFNPAINIFPYILSHPKFQLLGCTASEAWPSDLDNGGCTSRRPIRVTQDTGDTDMTAKPQAPSELRQHPHGIDTIIDALQDLRFGSVEITVHEGRIVLIERREKFRLAPPE